MLTIRCSSPHPAWTPSITSTHRLIAYDATSVVDVLFVLTLLGAKVGGEMSVAVLNAMNKRGRAAICGAISHYNEVILMLIVITAMIYI